MNKVKNIVEGNKIVAPKNKEKKYNIFNLSLSILLFIINGILLFFLPSEIPMQWNYDGTVAYTLPSVIGVWAMPCILLGMSLLLKIKQKISLSSSLVLLSLFVFNCVLLGYMI
ncbi:MAG: DUF1648 domain-containing protein [Clostridium sp.]